MTIEYTIRYNLSIKADLAPFFDLPHMWNVQPLEAIRFSAASSCQCDVGMKSSDAQTITVRDFLEILVSALPRFADYGNMVGFARVFFTVLEDRGDYSSLVDITNYIFKHLALTPSPFEPLLAERTFRIAHDLHYWANISLHAIRRKDPAYHLLPDALDAMMAGLPASELPEDVVFIFLTSQYLENLQYWLDLYKLHDAQASRLLVLAIGDGFAEPVHQWLQARGADRARVLEFKPPTKLGVCGNGTDLNFLWYLKIHVASALLQRGGRVIYSDLDAYWIKNYFLTRDAVNADVSADIIVSLTYDMPRCAVLGHGFTPCAGFFSAEPTDGGKALLAEWRRMTAIMFDDQIGLAEIIHRHGTSWMQHTSALIGATAGVATDAGVPVKLAALSPLVARRVGLPDPKTIEDATIWHPRWVMAPDQHREAIQHVTSLHKDRV